MDTFIPNGYILLARQLLESGIMQKPPDFLKTWIFLLEKANFKDDNNLKRGQGFTSIQEIIDALTYSVGYRKEIPTKKKIWGIIDWLRNPYEGYNEGITKVPMIVTTKVTHGFVYTVCKYDVYQNPNNYEGNNEGNDEGLTKVLRREQKGNNKYKNDIKNDNNEKNDNLYLVQEGQEKEIKQEDDKPKGKNQKNKPLLTKEEQELFEEVWQYLPRKEGFGRVSIETKKNLFQVGKDKMLYAINKYKKQIERQQKEMRFVMMGSTFLHSGYLDYLDGYEPEKTELELIADKAQEEQTVKIDYTQMILGEGGNGFGNTGEQKR